MKRIYYLSSLVLLLCFSVSTKAEKLQVNVTTPGTLSTLIGENRKNMVTNLTVSGNLNSADVVFLREMAGADSQLQPTKGQLEYLDMSGASFVKDERPFVYISKQTHSLYGGYNIPSYFMAYCRSLKKYVFPSQTKEIDSFAFCHIGLRSVCLPENVSVEKGSFEGDNMLTHVVFPKNIESLYDAFYGCCKIHQLVLNNVDYMSGECFDGMEMLERLVFKGAVICMDNSNTFVNCPNLEWIHFCGPVYSIGGQQILSNLPSLVSITFHAPILFTNIGKDSGCSRLKEYTACDIVASTKFSSCIGATPPQLLIMENHYKKLIAQTEEILKRANKNPKKNKIEIASLTRCLYNVACSFSIANMKDEALRILEISVNEGFSNYNNMKENKDLNNIRNDLMFTKLLEKVHDVSNKC